MSNTLDPNTVYDLINGVKAVVDRIEAYVKNDAVTTGLANIQASINALSSNIAALTTSVSLTKTTVDGINTQVASVGSNVAAMKEGIDSIDSDVQNVIDSLNTVYTQVSLSAKKIADAATSIASSSQTSATSTAALKTAVADVTSNLLSLEGVINTLSTYTKDLGGINSAKDALVGVTTSAQLVLDSLGKSADALMAIYREAVENIDNAAVGSVKSSLDNALSSLSTGVGSLISASDKVTKLATGIASLSTSTGAANTELSHNIELANSIVSKLTGVLNAISTNDVSLREVMIKLQNVLTYLDDNEDKDDLDRVIHRVTSVTNAIAKSADVAIHAVDVAHIGSGHGQGGLGNDYLE